MDFLLFFLLTVCGGFLAIAFVAWVFAAILKAVNRDKGPGIETYIAQQELKKSQAELLEAQRELMKRELLEEIRRETRDKGK